MKGPSVRNGLGALLVGALLCPLHLNAQFVYVNDNNALSNANTATLYTVINSGTALNLIGPYATTSTGNGPLPAPVQEVAASVSGSKCLFVSDPIGNTSSFPNGDVAAFTIGTGGVLTLVGNFVDPSDTSGPNHVIPLAIDRRPGFPYLFAAFQAEHKIASFKVGAKCQLSWISSTPPTTGFSGGDVVSMMVSRMGPHVLVVAYGDGSIQSFAIGGGFLTATQPAFNSTGFGNLNGGKPESVDITHNGMWSVFGDLQSSCAEVEVAQINPSTGALVAPTVDYGGPNISSGLNLCPQLNSRDIWLSPGQVGGTFYLYITNNDSGQVTTVRINQGSGAISPAGPCTGVYTNPTTLTPGSWSFPAGLHTVYTAGAGGRLVVAEHSAGSSEVALLKIQASSGCTKEVTSSPFPDPGSYLESIDVFPSRPY